MLEYIIRVAKPKTIVFSTFGVREGLLYEMLPQPERAKDGLICAAQTLNELLSRSARHAEELIAWTDRLVRVVKLRETEEDRRLRHAACLLSDIGWRVHPDHRGEQTLSLITNGNFGSISHQGRAFVALSVFYRYAGLSEENEPPALIRELVPPAMVERARVLGAAFRVAHLISAARPGVLPATHFRSQRPQADAGVRAPHGRSRRRPRRQPLQATGAAGRPLRLDRAELGSRGKAQTARRFPATKPYISSTMIAPTTAPMKPAPSPALYQPRACPRKEATNAPTMPRMVVMMNPDGSLLPGMMNFATTPARNPMMMVQIIPIFRFPI